MTTPQRLRFERRLFQTENKEHNLDVPIKRNEPDLTTLEPPEIGQFKKTVEFLQDQLRRTNIEVSRYQALLPAKSEHLNKFVEHVGLNESDPLPQWIVNMHYLSPLVLSYDERMEDLKQLVSSQQEQLSSLQKKARDITEENNQLRNLLKSELSEKLRDSSRQELIGNPIVGVEVGDQIRELEERIQLLKEENTILLEQQTSLEKEIDALKVENQQTNDLKIQFTDINNRYHECLQQIEHMRQDRNQLIESAVIGDNMAKSFLAKQEEYERLLEALKQQQRPMLEEARSLQNENESLLQKLYKVEYSVEQHRLKEHSLLSQIDRIRETQTQYLLDIQNIRKERDELLQSSITLERKLSESKQSESKIFKQMQDHIAMLEEANLEKNQAQVRELNTKREIQRLLEKMQTQKQTVEGAHQIEVGILKNQHKKIVEQQNDDIKRLVSENSDLKSRHERMQRDLRSFEEELSRTKKEPASEIMKMNEMLDDLRRKVVSMELERDAALQQVELISLAERRLQHQFQKEKNQFEAGIEDFSRKVKKMEKELLEVREDKIKLLAHIEELQRDSLIVQNAKESIEHKHVRDVTLLKKSQEAEKQQLQKELEDALNAQNRVTKDLQQLISKESDMKDRWQEEFKGVSSKYERFLQELRESNLFLTRQNEQLTQKINQLVLDYSVSQTRESQNGHHLQHVPNSEVSQSVLREAQLFQENEILLEKLEENSLQKTYLLREYDNLQLLLTATRDALKKCESEKISLDIEVQQLKETQNVLEAHIEKLKQDRTTLRSKLQEK